MRKLGYHQHAEQLPECRMCLAAHSHKQALVAKELQELGLLATPENPEPRALTADDLPKLLYLDAVRSAQHLAAIL